MPFFPIRLTLKYSICLSPFLLHFFSPSPSLSLHLNFQLSFSHFSSYIAPPSLSIFLKDLRLKIAYWHLRVLCHLIGYPRTRTHPHTHTRGHTHIIVINVFLHHLETNSLPWKQTWSQKVKEHRNRHPLKKNFSIYHFVCVCVCVCVGMCS